MRLILVLQFLFLLYEPLYSLDFHLLKNEQMVYTFKIDNQTYAVSSKGKIFNNSRQISHLPLDKEYRIQYIHFGYNSDIVLFVCAISSVEVDDNFGKIFCMNKKLSKLKWQCDIDHLEPGVPLLQENYLYVTAFSFIGKITLSDGKYVWKHLEFSSTDDYLGFDIPIADGLKVTFNEKSEFSPSKKRSIVVDDSNGTILSISE